MDRGAETGARGTLAVDVMYMDSAFKAKHYPDTMTKSFPKLVKGFEGDRGMVALLLQHSDLLQPPINKNKKIAMLKEFRIFASKSDEDNTDNTIHSQYYTSVGTVAHHLGGQRSPIADCFA